MTLGSVSDPEEGFYFYLLVCLFEVLLELRQPQKEQLLMALCPAVCLAFLIFPTHMSRKQAHLEVRKIPCFL